MGKRKKHSSERSHAQRSSNGGPLERSHHKKVISAYGHSLSSGWVQNLGVAIIGLGVITALRLLGISDTRATILSIGVLCTILVWIAVIGALKVVVPQETEYSGLLSPDHRPTPPNPCGAIPRQALVILLGNSAAYSSQPSHNVLKVKNDVVISFERLEGRIAINAMVFSRDGRIIAEIQRNEFFINPNNYFRKERPTPHCLKVFDQEGRLVLDVDYINSKAIRIGGIFNHPGYPQPVIISSKSGAFSGANCFGENQTDVRID